MRTGLVVSLLVVLVGQSPAQQPNTIQASAKWNGLDGPPYPIVQTCFSSGGYLTLEVTGAPNTPFSIAMTYGALGPAGLPTIFGLLDLDPTATIDVPVDGIFLSNGTALDLSAHTGANGSAFWVVPMPTTNVPPVVGVQLILLDSTALAGLKLTAATQMTFVHPTPPFIYVSAATGAPGNPGTQGAPFRSILEAIQSLLTAGLPYPQIRVALGTYPEPFDVHFPVSIAGGFDPVTWAAVPGARSTIAVGSTPAAITGITGQATLSHLEFVAAPAVAASGSSVALRVVGSSSTLTLDDCRFAAGNGAAGGAGQPSSGGTNGGGGGNGHDGFNGTIPLMNGGSPGTSLAGNPGGTGGVGTSGPGGAGQAAPNGGGLGGAGGCTGSTCGPYNYQRFWPYWFGQDGDAGPNGADGANGSGSAGGLVAGGVWIPGNAASGATGAAGKGGGGGGSGEVTNYQLCQFGVGGGGGGGGGGASPGGGGTGGRGGGASFAVLLLNSSPVFQNCEFGAGSGGSGGAGGAGGAGGTGGGGGPGYGLLQFMCSSSSYTNYQPGGAGGHGGNGGGGGGGGGGAGGWSFCVLRVGSSNPTFVAPNFTLGAGGLGGPGGAHGNPAQAGATGGVTGSSGTVN